MSKCPLREALTTTEFDSNEQAYWPQKVSGSPDTKHLVHSKHKSVTSGKIFIKGATALKDATTKSIHLCTSVREFEQEARIINENVYDVAR